MTDSPDERWVEAAAGRDDWAAAALDVLTATATHYAGVMTYADLAEQVQTRTRLRTRSHHRNWVGSVLAQVAARTRADGLPPLTSLVAHRADGGDPDDGTLRARLACYRRYADDVPAAVIAQAEAEEAAERLAAAEAARAKAATPRRRTTTARAGTSRTTAPRPTSRQDEPPAICPTCFMQLPASGACDTCG